MLTNQTMPVIFYILISIVLNVSGQISIKLGTKTSGALNLQNGGAFMVIERIFTNPGILAGLAFYCISAFFWIVALSKSDLSYAYPFLSLGYILIVIFSALILGETISFSRAAGIGFIIFGLFLIARH